MDLEYATVDLGDLSAAKLSPRIAESEAGPELVIADDEVSVRISAEFGSREQTILGVERLISAAREYLQIIRKPR